MINELQQQLPEKMRSTNKKIDSAKYACSLNCLKIK